MDNILEIYNDVDITIERSNTILTGELSEQTFNVIAPLSEHNKNVVDFETEDFSTSLPCTVSIGDSLVLSMLNIDRYDTESNSLDCTLYTNKMISDILNTPIRELVYSSILPWHSWSLRTPPTSYGQWSSVVGAEQISDDFWLYINGANGEKLKTRAYLNQYGYDKDYLDNDPTKPYLYKGIGAFREFQMHSMTTSINIINLVNQYSRQRYGFKIINIDDIPTHDTPTHDTPVYDTPAHGAPWIISGSENISPNNRVQFCCWDLGTKRQNTYTSAGSNYKDGIFNIPIAKLGSHICTDVKSVSAEESIGVIEGDTVVFNRDCMIQFDKIHCFADKYGPAPEDGRIKMRLRDRDGLNERLLFSWSGNQIKEDPYLLSIQKNMRGFKHVNDYGSWSDPGPAGMLSQIAKEPIIIHEGDQLDIVIDCHNEDDKLNLKYFNLVLKWRYVGDYEVTAEDYEKKMKYYSGLKSSDEEILDYESYFKIPAEGGTQQARINKVYKLFEAPYFDFLYDYFEFTDKSKRWSEFPVYNYYDTICNLGDLTLLQLLTDICVMRGWDIIEKEDGTLVVVRNLNAVDVDITEPVKLLSIDYVNDLFGVNNFIKFADDNSKLVSVSENKNLEKDKVIYEIHGGTFSKIGPYSAVDQYEQDGSINDSSSSSKLKNDCNFYVFRNPNGSPYDWPQRSLFDKILKRIDYSRIYTFEFPRILQNTNYINIHGQGFMIKSMRKEIDRNKTTIECFRVSLQ